MTFDRLGLAGWLLPGLCLAASAGVLVNRHAALTEASRDESRAADELERARGDVLAASRQPKARFIVEAPRDPNEETHFLTDLRNDARACGVVIARWNSRSTDYRKPEGGGTSEEALLEGVTKASCDLTLTGSYPALRSFLAALSKSDRLLTIARVDWVRTEGGSDLSMSLNRYLSPKLGTPKP